MRKKIIISVCTLAALIYYDFISEENRVNLLVYVEAHNCTEKLEDDAVYYDDKDDSYIENLLIVDEMMIKKLSLLKKQHYAFLFSIILISVYIGYIIKEK